jgi:protein TonB
MDKDFSHWQQDMTTDKHRKFGAYTVSLLVHGLLFFFIVTMTLDMTLPEGSVTDGKIEFTVAPKGAQTDTTKVSHEVHSEVPQLVKSKPAPPPPALPVKETEKDASDDFIPDPVGTLPVKDQEQAKKLPTKNVEPEAVAAVDSMKAVEEKPTEEPVPVAEPVPTPGTAVNAAPQESGQDQANLKAEDKTADQNYGTANGATDDKALSPYPSNRKPEYPMMARLRGTNGFVTLTFSVAADGSVSNVTVVDSDNQVFVQNALDAVKKWKYRAPVTPGTYQHRFNFQLKGDAQEMKSRLRSN